MCIVRLANGWVKNRKVGYGTDNPARVRLTHISSNCGIARGACERFILSRRDMKNLHRALGWKRRLIPVFLATLCFFSVAAFTQQHATRIATEIDNRDRVPIKRSKSPMARPENDAGRVPGKNKLEGINIFFSRSAEQEADLDGLIAAQQDSNSPLYHKWLTPEEFGFGLADSDIATVQSWLEQQGFTVNNVSPSKSHWNDDSAAGSLAAGGGAVSAFTARRSWQTGVTGSPSASYRLVPDISLDASAYNAGYLYCSGDSAATQIAGSCSNGFRDSSNKYLTVAGGTSFASCIFAGMVAILGQKLISAGLGVINSKLYSLGANSSTYASAFHDITSGGSACPAAASYCSSAGASEYPATTSYDEATGLGSMDFYNLLNAWTSCASPIPSTTTPSAATSSVARGANDVINITVASACNSVTTTPTGTVTIAVDGTAQSPSLSLSNGSVTYTFSSTTRGFHTIAATYSGDSTFASSSGSVNVTVTASKTFTLSATDVTVSAGNTGTSTVTITPKNGYAGTVTFTVSSSSSLTNGCFFLPNTTASGSSAVTASLTVRTNSSACESGALAGPAVGQQNFVGLALAGLPLVTLLVYHFSCHRLGMIAGVFLLLAIGFALLAISGCGGGGYGSNAAKETYTVTIVGTDTGSSSITASTTMTLTID